MIPVSLRAPHVGRASLFSLLLLGGLIPKGVAQETPTTPATPIITLEPAITSDPVAGDADDPALWLRADDPKRSLIIGTDKASKTGALYVFGLDGRVRQTIPNLDRPNNVDVEYGLQLGGRPLDIAVTTERNTRRLRVFGIVPDEKNGGRLEDLLPQGLPVFEGADGESGAPMGIALYKRPRDGAVFAIVGRKTGPTQGYLWQYRLQDDGTGKLVATKVREFGSFSGKGEIEAIAVDDALGTVYYADEGDGIHKWAADPDSPDANRELARFGTEGWQGDREGIGIYTRPDGTGYIVCTDQIDGQSEYHVFAREGEPGRPHDHSRTLAILRGTTDETDGIEVVSAPLGDAWPSGLLIAMNSGAHNFQFFDWRTIAAKPPFSR